MKWITFNQAIALHDKQILFHGGGAGIRDQGLLISALERPKNIFYSGERDIHVPLQPMLLE